MKKFWIAFFLALLIGSFCVAMAEASETYSIVIDTADEAVISASYGEKNTQYVKRSSSSVKWHNHTKNNHVSFKSKISNWDNYAYLDFMMYSEKATGAQFIFQAICADGAGYMYRFFDINWAGWKHFKIPLEEFKGSGSNPSFKNITSVNLYAEGWNMVPSAESVLYVENIYLAGEYEFLNSKASQTVAVDMNMQSNSRMVTDVSKKASKSMKWANQDKTTHLDFPNSVSSDWSEYTHLTMWMYSEKAIGSKLLAGIECADGLGYFRYPFSVDWVGWKQIKIPISAMIKSKNTATLGKISKIWLYADGWGMTPNPETVVYLDSIFLETIKDEKLSFQESASTDDFKKALESVSGLSLWHYGNKSVLVNGNRVFCDKENKYIKENGIIYVPETFFADMLNIQAENVDFKYFEGEKYIPLEKTAKELGVNILVDKKFIFASNNDLSNLKNSEALYLAKTMYSREIPDFSGITGEDFENAILKWENYLTGNDMENSDVVAEKKNSDEWYALYYQRTKGTPVVGNVITGYWDIVIDSTADMNIQFTRLRQMAVGYATKGTDSYKSESLKNDILSMLDWMYENLYGVDEMNNCGWRDTTLFNWWEWQIGVPQNLSQILLLMRNDMSSEDMNKYLKLIDYFADYDGATGANLVDTAYPRLISALLKKNSKEFFEIKTYLERDMAYQQYTNGEGTHRDGSYRYHYYYAMNGTYGTSYVYGIAMVVNILNGTKFAITGCEKDEYIEWIFKGFETTMYNGKLMSMFRGRHPGGEKGTAISVVNGLLQIADIMDNDEYQRLCSAIKYNCVRGGITPDSGFKYPAIKKYNEIMSSSEIPLREKYSNFNVFYITDKVVWQNNNFAFAISMNSSRTSGWESINGENKKGWYQGDGMVYMYYPEDNTFNYENEYWNKVDPYMLPGTTVDEQEREERSIHDQRVYKSSKNFVGGVSLKGKSGIAVMELESCHNDYDDGMTSTYGNSLPVHNNDLVAKKAWFAFDDELVALGSGINSTMNSNVKTVIENRIADGVNIVADDVPVNAGTENAILTPGYINVNDKAGYIFNNNTEINLKKEVDTYNFLKIWTNHGKNPVNEKYSYITLPDKTVEETKAYYENPDVKILANTESVQAVKEKNGITGYVFWESGSFNNVTTNKPIVMMLKENGNYIDLAVSDPTQKLDSVTVNAGIEKIILLSGDERISVGEKGDITFNLSGLNGATVEAKLYRIPDLEVISRENGYTVKNNSDLKQSFNVIIAEYENKKLKYISAEEKEIEAEKQLEISKPSGQRLFIWLNTDKIMPVPEAKGDG
ncbi:MAG: polysaccharide lyase 8 family protein [Clostridia bacterium]|nr:polysaccharide lyase 8 family protein [Clostridia bacterium]